MAASKELDSLLSFLVALFALALLIFGVRYVVKKAGEKFGDPAGGACAACGM